MWVRRLGKLALAVAVSAACIAVLARTVDPSAVIAALATAHLGPVAAAFVLALALPFWRGARLAHLLPVARRPGGGVLTAIAAEVLLWGFVLPFKLGELSFPWLLHRRLALPLGEAAGVFLFVRVVDLAAIVGLFAVAVGLTGLAGGAIATTSTVAAGALVAFAPILLIGVARRWRGRLPARWRNLEGVLNGASHAVSGTAKLHLAVTTAGLWCTHAVIAVLAFAAIGLSPLPAAALLASSAGNLAFALPVNGALGLGPQQVAFATAAGWAGVAWPEAVAAALTTYVVVVAAALIAGLAARLRPPSSPIA